MRAAIGSALAALALTLLNAIVAASPAGAPVGDNHGGSNKGGSYSAWAFYARATGGGGVDVRETCTLPRPRDWPENKKWDVPAHIEYNVISYDEGKTYRVWKDCVANGENVDDVQEIFPDEDDWDILDYWDVTPADPQEMIEEVISRLNPTPPSIVTDPGDGLPSLVGIDTRLMFDEPLGRQAPPPVSDGPITVEVWADPVGDVRWDTGDGIEACNGTPVAPPSCNHVYNESSAGQQEVDGRPSYRITAEIMYTGGYAVYANGAYVGGSDDIGDIARTSETHLAVAEAQAINTGG